MFWSQSISGWLAMSGLFSSHSRTILFLSFLLSWSGSLMVGSCMGTLGLYLFGIGKFAGIISTFPQYLIALLRSFFLCSLKISAGLFFGSSSFIK